VRYRAILRAVWRPSGVLCVAALLAAMSVGQAQALSLADDGRPLGPIVVPDDASSEVVEAAQELAGYLDRITGAAWDVVAEGEGGDGPGIFVGVTRRGRDAGVQTDGLAPDGFRIRTAAGGVFIVGADDAGTRFGVYELLEEHCGCRWFAPGEIGEVVPSDPGLAIPDLDYSEEPSFPSRSIWLSWGYKIDREKYRRYAAWCRHNRLGGVDSNMGHNLHAALPYELFDGDPELFPLIDGHRFRPSREADWQPCTSNPEVIRRIVADARRYFDAYPHEWLYSLSPIDGFGWCECEDCRALDPPEYRDDRRYHKAWRFVPFANAVADELAQSHPDRVVGFYAYLGVLDPPTGLRLRDNVVVGLCRYGRAGDNFHPIPAPAEVSEACAFYRQIIEGWAEVAHQFVAREYFTMLLGPDDAVKRVAQAAHLADDIRYYRDHGFVGINSQAAPEWGSAGLNFYLAAKLMWDADADVPELLQDYYDKYYGPAGPMMRSYFETCQDLAIAGAEQERDLFDADQIDLLQQYLDEALAGVAGTVYAQRVSITLDLFRLWRMGRELPDAGAPGSVAAAQRYLDFAASLEGTDAMAYEHFRYVVLHPPELPQPEPYDGPDLVPLFPDRAAGAPEEGGAWLRGLSSWLVRADAGERVGFEIQHRWLGRLYLSPLVYQVVSPSGEIAETGSGGLGQSSTVSFEAQEAGIYELNVDAGINSYAVSTDRRAVLKGGNVHFHQRGQRYWFYVPPDVPRFDISVHGEWSEAARLRIFDPDGGVRYDAETDEDGGCVANIQAADDERGRPWSLLVSEPAGRVFDDAYLSILGPIPPYLAARAEDLLVPIPAADEPG